MKLTATSFYSAVTDKGCNFATAVEGLRRWGVPYNEEEIGNRKRGIDIALLPAAQAKYAEELRAKAERKVAEAARVPRPVGNGQVAEKLDRVIELLEKIHATLDVEVPH